MNIHVVMFGKSIDMIHSNRYDWAMSGYDILLKMGKHPNNYIRTEHRDHTQIIIGKYLYYNW